MQSSVEEKLRPEVDDFHEEEEKQEEELISRNEEDEEEGGADEEEFSFTSSFGELSLVSADDAFVDGELKPVFPLFNNRSLLFDAAENLPKKPAVKKIFVQAKGEEAEDHRRRRHEDGEDVISGPYCDLSSRRVVEVASSSSDSCKKSNSTGFSKIWRFKELVSRTNSDGRDAFVFLNEPPRLRPEKTNAGVAVRSAAERVKVSGGKRTTPYSAHEVYLRRKGKEEKKRPSSYLPYRPELMGFFTTVNGGFSKNVHPY